MQFGPPLPASVHKTQADESIIAVAKQVVQTSAAIAKLDVHLLHFSVVSK